MKYLILLMPLISFAQFKLEITNSEGQQMIKECETMEVCNAYVEKFKHKWGRDAGWLRFDCGNATSTRTVQDEIDGDITEYHCPANYSVNTKDISQELQMKKIIGMAAQNIKCGESVKAFIGARNVMTGKNKAQIKSLIKKYTDMNAMLSSGALDTAIEELEKTPADDLITASDKTKILLEIQKCKAVW